MPSVTSAHNPRLKRLAALLAHGKTRRAEGLAVLEGVHLLDAYLNCGGQPQRVYIPEHRLRHPEIQALTRRLPENRIVPVADGLLGKIGTLDHADDAMTLIALPDAPPPPSSGDCIALDRVQDPGNLGTVLRSAAASGITHIILGSGCADPYAPKVLRAGMGAHFLLHISAQTDLPQWLAGYRDPVYATALAHPQPVPLYALDLRRPAAWLFGNEGSGVAPELLERANFGVHIPMAGATESLNIAMAATVCLFEQMRQRIQAA